MAAKVRFQGLLRCNLVQQFSTADFCCTKTMGKRVFPAVKNVYIRVAADGYGYKY